VHPGGAGQRRTGRVKVSTNLFFQDGLTAGVIAPQRPRAVVHAFSVRTSCKKGGKMSFSAEAVIRRVQQ